MSEIVFGVHARSLTSTLRAINADMNRIEPEGHFYSPSLSEVRAWDAGSLHDYMQAFGDRSLDSAKSVGQLEVAPKTIYGRAIIAASKIDTLSIHRTDSTCIQSEPYFFKSLSYHNPQTAINKGIKDFPAAILLDENDNPIGYEKSSGVSSTYVWDPISVSTRSGLQSVPGDSLCFVTYTEDLEDRLFEKESGLVIIRACKDTMINFGAAKLGSASYPKLLRKAMAAAAAEMEHKLLPYANASSMYKPHDIKKKVHELITSGAAEIIEG